MKKKEVDIEAIKVEKLHERLRHGDVVRIAEDTGYSTTYVSNVLSPKKGEWNEDIIRGALRLLNSRRIELVEDLADSLVA